jgi:hypothetical protein
MSPSSADTEGKSWQHPPTFAPHSPVVNREA